MTPVITNSRLSTLYHECVNELTAIHAPISNNIVLVDISSRTSAWGDCKKTNGRYRIRVSKYLMEADDLAVKTTLIHELLHTIPDGFKHTGNWKLWAGRVNNQYGYNVKRCTSAEEKGVDNPRKKTSDRRTSDYKYKITCLGCHHDFYYKRDCRTVQCCATGDARCHCGSNLFRVIKL